MNVLARAALAASVAALAVAGCDANGPSTPSPSEGSPSASSSSEVRQAGPLELAQVQDLLANLPTSAPFIWRGGVSTSSPAHAQSTWLDYAVTPLQCAPFYHLQFLHFKDDREAAPGDVTLVSTLVDPAGAGPDDDRIIAAVTVRLLDEPRRGMGDGIYRLNAALADCASGYVVEELKGGWEMQNVSRLEPFDVPQPPGIDGTFATVAQVSGAFSTPQETWTWIAVDNLLVVVSGYVDPTVPESSVDHQRDIASAVAEAFSHAS